MRPIGTLALAASLALLAADVADGKPKKAPSPPPRAPSQEQPFWDRVAHPDHPRYLALLDQGAALLAQEKPGAAVEPLAEAARLEPDQPDAWYLLGMAHKALDRWADCADALARVDALRPGGYVPPSVRAVAPEPAFSLGLCAAVAGRHDVAIAAYERALAVDSISPDVRAQVLYNLGDVLHAEGRLEDAIRTYQDAIDLTPRSPLYHFSLAVALDRDEQGQRARDAMQVALAYDPMLSVLGHPGTVWTPAEDELYFRGFAYEVAAPLPTLRTCAPSLLCRPLARAYFRQYLARAGDSPWRARAAAHLLDLGGGAPVAGEVQVSGPADGSPEWRAVAKLVVDAAPRLQACMKEAPQAIYRVDVTLPAKAARPVKPAPAPRGGPPPSPPIKGSPPKDPFGGGVGLPAKRPPPPGGGFGVVAERTFNVQNASPLGHDEAARACVLDVVKGLAWPKAGPTQVRVVFAVAAP